MWHTLLPMCTVYRHARNAFVYTTHYNIPIADQLADVTTALSTQTRAARIARVIDSVAVSRDRYGLLIMQLP